MNSIWKSFCKLGKSGIVLCGTFKPQITAVLLVNESPNFNANLRSKIWQ